MNPWLAVILALIAIIPATIGAYVAIRKLIDDRKAQQALALQAAQDAASALQSEQSARASAEAASATALSLHQKDVIIDALQEELVRVREGLEHGDIYAGELRESARNCERLCDEIQTENRRISRDNASLRTENARLTERVGVLEAHVRDLEN